MTLVAPLSLLDSDWLQLRTALWPDSSDAEHQQEMTELIAAPDQFGQFLARSSDGRPIGLAEVSLRTDYVNGTETSPVAFLEGLYVAPDFRRQGVARALLAAVSAWASIRGSTELASDTPLDNTVSQVVHASLGFKETERVVYFNMKLGQAYTA